MHPRGRTTCTPINHQKEPSEEPRTKEPSIQVLTPLDLSFEEFWKAWPNKVGQLRAKVAFRQKIDEGVPAGEIINGVHRYVRSKPNDRAWMNPQRFIEDERFRDEGAKSGIDTAFDSLIERMRL